MNNEITESFVVSYSKNGNSSVLIIGQQDEGRHMDIKIVAAMNGKDADDFYNMIQKGIKDHGKN